MTEEQYEQLSSFISRTVTSTVKETVNGKIDRISQKLDDYIISDNEWKADAKPAIDTMKSTKAGAKIIIGFIGLFGAIGTLWQIFKVK